MSANATSVCEYIKYTNYPPYKTINSLEGPSMYSAIAGVFLCNVCGFLSYRSELASRSYHVRRRIESGERIVCVA